MKKILKNKDFQVWSGMIIGSLIYSLGVVFILDLGRFYASGVTGTSQLIETVIRMITKKDIIGIKSIFIIGLNAPMFIIGWKGVSRRFAIVSLGSVIFQTIVIALFELWRENGFNPFAPLQNDILTLSIIGGLVTGVGGGICLRNGSSTGGMDILTQFLSLKKNFNFATLTLIIDMIIITLGWVVTGEISVAIYTVIRLIVYIIVMDKLHTIYNFVKLSIVTEKVEEVREALLKSSRHAITIYKAEGGYSKREKYVLETVVSSFETFDVVKAARSVDGQCFVTHTADKNIEGQFNRQTIA